MDIAYVVSLLIMLVSLSHQHLPQVDEGSYTVCQKFTGVFNPRRGGEDVSVDQGKPGKMGPKGEIGPRGPKGSPGNVDESAKIILLENELRAIKDCPGLFRAGLCYFLLDEKMNYQKAEATCRRNGGKLVVIDNKQIYGALMRYAHDSILAPQDGTVMQLWMDGTYRNGVVTLSDGRVAPYLIWYNNYPRSTTGDIHMAFEIKKNYVGVQHMFNIHGRHTAYPLCQKM